MDELKRCPCCGSNDIKLLTRTAYYDMPHNRGRRAVICVCGLTMHGRTDEEAIEKWNRRTPNYVVKVKDTQEYLTETENSMLQMLLLKIENGRIKNGKKLNAYFVVNHDEPYAMKVLDVILNGEDTK